MTRVHYTLVRIYIGLVVALACWQVAVPPAVSAQVATVEPTVETSATAEISATVEPTPDSTPTLTATLQPTEAMIDPASIPTSAAIPPTNTKTSGGGGSSAAPTGTATPTPGNAPTITLTVTDVPMLLPSVTPIPQAPSRLPVTGFIDGSDIWQNTSLIALMSILGVVGIVFFMYGRD